MVCLHAVHQCAGDNRLVEVQFQWSRKIGVCAKVFCIGGDCDMVVSIWELGGGV